MSFQSLFLRLAHTKAFYDFADAGHATWIMRKYNKLIKNLLKKDFHVHKNRKACARGVLDRLINYSLDPPLGYEKIQMLAILEVLQHKSKNH